MAPLKKLLYSCGLIISYLWPLSWGIRFHQITNFIYSGYLRRHFMRFGENSCIEYKSCALLGLEHIVVGDNTSFARRLRLTAWPQPEHPNGRHLIKIGNDCNFGEGNHITASNSISIGNHLLTGANVLISDNAHGAANNESLNVPPIKRPLISKGEVHIGNYVWIGDKACILSGVHIGNNVIIGANSVVTQDIPDNCVAAGIPARVIKKM